MTLFTKIRGRLTWFRNNQHKEDVKTLLEALDVATEALSKHRPDCASCSGTGSYEVTKDAEEFGNSGWETVTCDCCIDKEALAKLRELSNKSET